MVADSALWQLIRLLVNIGSSLWVTLIFPGWVCVVSLYILMSNLRQPIHEPSGRRRLLNASQWQTLNLSYNAKIKAPASNIKGLSDIAGKRLAVIPGTTTENMLAETLQKANIEVELVKVREHSDGIAVLENGGADAYASDRVILISLALTSKDPKKLALAEQYLSYEPYGMMLRRGDADFRLAVNRVLSRLYRSGQIYPIYERWFGAVDRASPLLQSMYRLHGLPE